MVQLLGYIFLIAVAILAFKFVYALIMRCCALGVIAFICVGCISGGLWILGYLESDTALTISRWAFYIGTAINVIEAISHPLDVISDAWELATDTVYTNEESSTEESDYTSNSNYDTSSFNGEGNSYLSIYAGRRCCGNCRWNNCHNGNNVLCSHNPAGANNDVNDVCSDYIMR